MVQVEMAHDNGLHVFDVVSGCFDGCGEFVIFGVLGSGKNVSYGSAPFLRSAD